MTSAIYSTLSSILWVIPALTGHFAQCVDRIWIVCTHRHMHALCTHTHTLQAIPNHVPHLSIL